MRKIRRVLVVLKKTAFQSEVLEKRDGRVEALIAQGSEAVSHMVAAHERHEQSVAAIVAELQRLGIEHAIVNRDELEELSIIDFDLIITVGGDGTFLDASHCASGIPILGINSSTATSVGHYCAADANSFPAVFEEIRTGKRKPFRLMRLALTLNGEAVKEGVLNELLVHHACPAGTSRYIIEAKGIKEEQKSSGIWIGTPAGSTGATRSARGKILPITQRQVQFIVREPCSKPGERFKLTLGLMPAGSQVRIVSQMPDARLFIDGAHIEYDFPMGTVLTVSVHPQDLIAYVDANRSDRYR